MRNRRRIVVLIALAIVGAALYAAFFDKKGKFAPTSDADAVVERVGTRVTEGAQDVKRSAKKAQKKLAAPKPKKTVGQRYKDQIDSVH